MATLIAPLARYHSYLGQQLESTQPGYAAGLEKLRKLQTLAGDLASNIGAQTYRWDYTAQMTGKCFTFFFPLYRYSYRSWSRSLI